MANPFRTLRGRLATTYAVTALLAVGASAFYTINTLRGGLLERVALDLSDEALLLADSLSQPMSQNDPAALDAVVTRANSLSHAHLLVINRDYRVVGFAHETPPWPNLRAEPAVVSALQGQSVVTTDPGSPGLLGGEELVRVTLPVVDDTGEVLGAIRATYTLDDLQALISRLNVTTLIVAVGAAIVAAVAGLLLGASVARPAGQVVQAALDLAGRRPAGPPYGANGTAAFPSPLPLPRGSTDEIRSLVEAFNSLADQLRVHEQARREFASDVSHELHSLASAMQTAAEALERGAAEANPALGQRLVGGLVGHTRRLTRLADDLLELARWEGGRLRLDVQEMDLGELVRGTLDEWTPEARRRGISLEVRLPVGSLDFYGDPIRLTQAVGNLIENAIKYTGQDGYVRVELTEDDEAYELSVTDSGPGIPAEVLPRVFERYFRVEGRASGGPGGMGLGLAIARAIVLAHGGSLAAESPADGGARFVLRLRRSLYPAPHAPADRV